ncbi:MAG: DUF4184 family protein [Bacteroidia bacterium]
MAFTFSHPAAVLPARFLPGKYVSMTALVVGSVTPDFEYFIHMKNYGPYGHTLLGMFWFDLPLGFIITFIYHYFVRDGLIDNLPGFLRNRLAQFKGFDWLGYVKQHFLIVVICLIVGIFTHLVWDNFTHKWGYFVALIPWLSRNTEIFGVCHVRYYILQNLSSVAGLLLIIYAIWRIPKTGHTGKSRTMLKYWVISACITCIITVPRSILYKHYPTEEIQVIPLKPLMNDLTIPQDIIMTAISAIIISLIITPIIIKKRN